VLISTAPQGIGDSLQNRLLAPLVFSGLIHQVVRRRRLGTLFTRMLFGADPDPELVEFARRLMAQAPRQTTIDAPKAVLRFDFRERLDRVTLPTLVLSGSRDRSVKPEHTQALADGIPQARLQRFPGAGHLVVLERAHQIAEAVTDFAASCG
jgi:non-heme chloroperoxidase